MLIHGPQVILTGGPLNGQQAHRIAPVILMLDRANNVEHRYRWDPQNPLLARYESTAPFHFFLRREIH